MSSGLATRTLSHYWFVCFHLTLSPPRDCILYFVTGKDAEKTRLELEKQFKQGPSAFKISKFQCAALLWAVSGGASFAVGRRNVDGVNSSPRGS